MMTVPLNDLTPEELHKVVDEVHFTEDAVARELRWRLAGVNLDQSLGVVHEGNLISFLVNVPLEGKIFNFLSGTIPRFRHQNILKNLYEVLFTKDSFSDIYLEVEGKNEAALKLYHSLGFIPKRKLFCFEGTFLLKKFEQHEYQMTPLTRQLPGHELLLSRPSLENSFEVLQKASHYHEVHSLRENNQTLAWAVYTPCSLSLKQIGGLEEKYLDELFWKMKLNREYFQVSGIESNSVLVSYFKKRGMKMRGTMIEMQRATSYKCHGSA